MPSLARDYGNRCIRFNLVSTKGRRLGFRNFIDSEVYEFSVPVYFGTGSTEPGYFGLASGDRRHSPSLHFQSDNPKRCPKSRGVVGNPGFLLEPVCSDPDVEL